MHGPLSEIGLIEVLQLLERGQRSGRLRIMGGGNGLAHTLRIRAGQVVAVEPAADDAALLRALHRRAELAPGDTEVEAVPATHREAVRERLARQALGVMLHWDRGRFDFEAGDVPDGPLAWSSDALVLDLVATESRRAELAAALADWKVVPEQHPAETMPQAEPVVLEALDWRIVDAVDGRRDVAAIAAHLGEPLEEVGERIRALESAAILHLRQPQGEEVDLSPVARAIEANDPGIEHLEARLRQVPTDGAAWRALGLMEVGAGRFERAVVAWTAWQKAVPADAAAASVLIQAAHTMMEAMRDSRE